MSNVLLDASFLVALGHLRDANHHTSKDFIAKTRHTLLTPDVVLAETMYNIERLGGSINAIRFGEFYRLQPPKLISLTNPDFDHSIALMRQYRDAELDFVDCCITALAERMNITYIATYDRRDFSMIRPNHTEYFELLP